MAQIETSREVDAVLRSPTNVEEAIHKLFALHRAPCICKAIPFLMSVLRNDVQQQGARAAEVLLLLGAPQPEPKAFFEAEFKKTRIQGIFAAQALGHIGPETNWAMDSILKLWRTELEPKDGVIAPHDKTLECIVNALWTLHPPIERVLEPLMQALLHVEHELSENIQDLICSYDRAASEPLCEIFRQDRGSLLNSYSFCSAML